MDSPLRRVAAAVAVGAQVGIVTHSTCSRGDTAARTCNRLAPFLSIVLGDST